MSWTVVFSDYSETQLGLRTANELACVYGPVHHCFRRIEWRPNDGARVCPPVGMRADEASHRWSFDFDADFDKDGYLPDKLVPRQKTAIEIQQEYHSDPDGDLDGYDGA